MDLCLASICPVDLLGRSKGQKEDPELGEYFGSFLRLRLVDIVSSLTSFDRTTPYSRNESYRESKRAHSGPEKTFFERPFLPVGFFFCHRFFFFSFV